eukprot:57066-Chlamydomonas_euryale.AAC.1
MCTYAHTCRTRARNNNYSDIVRGMRGVAPNQMDCLTGYHHVFWVGDLNYRLDFGKQVHAQAEGRGRGLGLR